MRCPYLVDGPSLVCLATREVLIAGIHDVALCRSPYWTECRAASFGEGAHRTGGAIEPAETEKPPALVIGDRSPAHPRRSA